VLVVDYGPMVRDTPGQVPSGQGYGVDPPRHTQAAPHRGPPPPPDAILLDLMMPGMNGRQFLQALRENPAWTGVPVLIMTAVHGLNVNLQQLGASEVVEKPFNVDELLNKVALAVYRSRDAQSPSQPLPVTPLQPPPVPEAERGVVLIVEHDRARLQQLDLMLSARGYTVVSMTRSLVQISRLARALRPRAILLDLKSEGVHDLVADLRSAKELDDIPLLVFAREAGAEVIGADLLAEAADIDLINFVERQRGG